MMLHTNYESSGPHGFRGDFQSSHFQNPFFGLRDLIMQWTKTIRTTLEWKSFTQETFWQSFIKFGLVVLGEKSFKENC